MSYSYFAHPNSVCMSYLGHMCFSLRMGWLMFLGVLKAIVHAVFPCLFVHGTTDTTMTIQHALRSNGCRPPPLTKNEHIRKPPTIKNSTNTDMTGWFFIRDKHDE